MHKHSRLLTGMSLAFVLATGAADRPALAQDAAAPKPDAAAPKPDAAAAKPDAAAPKPDAAAPKPDAAAAKPDAAAPKPDAAAPKPDAAAPKPDAAAAKPDAAAPKPDAAAPKPDAAAPKPDAAAPKPDTAAPKPDAAAPQQGAPVPEQGAAAPEPPQQTLQVLNGKLNVVIPRGFTETEFPPDPAAPDVTGKIYLNRAAMQAIIVVNVPMEFAFGDDDAFTLGSMAAGFQSQQQEAVPSFKKTGQSTFKVGGIGVLQLDATSRLSGQPAVLTALFAASGKQVVTFSAYTLNQEKARHPELIKQLTEGMSAAP